IFHHNRYNQYCLADDMMEPYRPYIDLMVAEVVERENEAPDFLSKEHREKLLTIPTITVSMNGKQRPLMIAASETSASLVRCFAGEQRKLVLPIME
ncbi:MAG: CRISPR-associated endonuclease Cas1, partial [Flavobacteriales bacterium]|nr:CRISPR-associated endonuclease Cas1 [Flavobacteriales bacterium]